MIRVNLMVCSYVRILLMFVLVFLWCFCLVNPFSSLFDHFFSTESNRGIIQKHC